jgi:hypothetical protein
LITLKKIAEVLGPAEIYKGGRWMPITEEVQMKFDHDLEFGRLGEDFVKSMQSKNTKIEVKTERDIWKTTGNIAIEIRCRGKKSGISVTEADTWIHLLSYENNIEGGFIFSTKYLKDKIVEMHKNKEIKLVMGGDDNMSQMVLIPIEKLFIK